MPLTQRQLAPYLHRFLDMLDAAFRGYGSPHGLPDRLRDAVRLTPRHHFVHRFRIGGGPLRARPGDGTLADNDADPARELADIYSDAVMTHVDAAGAKLPSTNSQPSYVLWLLHLLDLQPGHRVLEIGSGSGWLAAVIARLVGPTGRVTGLELIPALAAQSRDDLAALGLADVAIHAADGADGHPAAAPFDRVMITAACWDLPVALFDQVIDGGRVLVPVELRGGGCQVTVLRRDGFSFVAERATPGWFVPLLGPGQRRPLIRAPLADLPFWPEIGAAPTHRAALPLATGAEGTAGTAVDAFRAFLGRIAPGFTIFGGGDAPERRPWLPPEPFGLVDHADRSVALWTAGELRGYGGPNATRTLARAYATWADLGLPGPADLHLEIVRRPRPTPPDTWPEPRTTTTLLWQPHPHAKAWTHLTHEHH